MIIIIMIIIRKTDIPFIRHSTSTTTKQKQKHTHTHKQSSAVHDFLKQNKEKERKNERK